MYQQRLPPHQVPHRRLTGLSRDVPPLALAVGSDVVHQHLVLKSSPCSFIQSLLRTTRSPPHLQRPPRTLEPFFTPLLFLLWPPRVISPPRGKEVEVGILILIEGSIRLYMHKKKTLV